MNKKDRLVLFIFARGCQRTLRHNNLRVANLKKSGFRKKSEALADKVIGMKHFINDFIDILGKLGSPYEVLEEEFKSLNSKTPKIKK